MRGLQQHGLSKHRSMFNWPETSPNDGGMIKISLVELMEFWWIERNSNQ